jgi:hypothetical protein
MDDPASQRIDEVAADLSALHQEVRVGFAQVQTEFAELRTDLTAEQHWTRAEFAAQREWTRAEFAAVRAEAAEFRAEVRDGFAEMRRHFDVVAEDLRGMIRLLAEGLVAVNERIDRLETRVETRMAEGFAELRDLIRLSYTDLDGRVRVLEGRAGL